MSGQRAAARGAWGEAERSLRAALKLEPGHVEATKGLSAALMAFSKIADAQAVIQDAIEAHPNDHTLHLAMGELRFADQDAEGALAAFRGAVRLAPDQPSGYNAIASVLEGTGDLDGASEAIEQGLVRAPSDDSLRFHRAKLLRRTGDAAASEAALREVDPAKLQPGVRAAWHHELGMALEALGKIDDAFVAFQNGNAAVRAAHRLDGRPPSSIFRVCELTARIPRESFQAWGRSKPSTTRRSPVMLVGFPRSGTTLSDQVLSAHPDTVVFEERPLLNPMVSKLYSMFPGSSDVRTMLDALTPAQCAALRSLYTKAVESELNGAGLERFKKGELVAVHKMPLDIAQVGVVSRVLPDTRWITVLRDPRDACLSCFKQHFRVNDTSRHFTDLSETVRLYNAAMGCWARVRGSLSLDWTELPYEKLTEDPESESRRLIEFLGLEWDDAVLSFYEQQHRRVVTTPSYEGVNAPMNTKAVGRWRQYERHVAEAFEKLGPMVEAFGYGR